MNHCPSCGTRLDESWDYCGNCGHLVREDQHAAPTEPIGLSPQGTDEPRDMQPAGASAVPSAAPRERSRPGGGWRRVLVIVVVVVLVTAGVATASVAGYRLNRTLDHTEADLASRSRTLGETEQELEATRIDLQTTKRERDELRAKAEDLRLDLGGLRGTLQKAENKVELQAGQIGTLKTCLNGVSLALDAVIYLDYRGAARALQAVETECNEAFALF